FSNDSIDSDHHLAMLVAIGVVLSVLSTMAQGRALVSSRHRALALAMAATGVMGSAASIGIAFWRQDVLALLLPMAFGYLISVLLLGIPSMRKLAMPSRLTWDEGIGVVKIGIAGVITAPMYWLLTSSDRWVLQHYHGAGAVGVYSIGYSIASVGMMINAAVMSVWQPEAAREYEEDHVRAQVTLGRLMSRLVA